MTRDRILIPSRPPLRGAERRRPRAGERGAALLVVMVAVAVLTALAVELAYDTRVSLRIAANARDDLKASYAARGGVALSRLVLSLQQEIDRALQPPGGAQAQLSLPRPQLWRVVPVSSALAGGLFGGGGALAPEGDAAGAATADGFEAVIDDEGRKINVQLDGLPSSVLLRANAQALYQLICDPRWDALFDRDDAHGVRASRQELLVYLRDWVDDDEEGSTNASVFPPGTCVMQTPVNTFDRGYQDENYPYDRGPDRYRAKNARMDSLAELYMVAGIGDAFVAAFGDALTVHLPRDAKRNLNDITQDGSLLNARLIAIAPDHPALADPEFAVRLHTSLMEATFGGILGVTPQLFFELVRTAGVPVNETLAAPATTPFDDRSLYFRVRSVGRAGEVTKTIDAVVWFDSKASAAAGATPAAAAAAAAAAATSASIPGKLVHWREE